MAHLILLVDSYSSIRMMELNFKTSLKPLDDHLNISIFHLLL